ncbi:uncharacterized protein [Prorops nasuta]|uniref:uncharacterized protein isoform X3 n=1 Tax=Prorops nasuta TaxID=863751 RepID=UPI0034CFB11A
MTYRHFASRTVKNWINNIEDYFTYGSHVADAKKNHIPLVALESTIITHGMPYPENFKTAISVENAVRKQKVVPATIGILGGKIHIGLNPDEIEYLARNDTKKVKCSRRDLPFCIAQGLNSGTTVSATMVLAHLAKILIMATGGIGGVHRGVNSSFDISTDLIELGQTPVLVVCSGIKSILDIRKTLEFLETQGVPVLTIESYALDPEMVEQFISRAVEKAETLHIFGKDVTPFILQELDKITNARTTRANIALIINNATVAAEIATILQKKFDGSSAIKESEPKLKSFRKNPVIVGGAVYDTTIQIKDSEIKTDGRTLRGRSRYSCGGVGRNVTEALIKLGLKESRLISVIGEDMPGFRIIQSLQGAQETLQQLPNINTAKYRAIVDHKGECMFGIGEMEAFDAINVDLVQKHQSLIEAASLILIDGNLPENTIRSLVDVAANSKIPVWYEPTDIRKARKIFDCQSKWEDVIHFISPNINELFAISDFFGISRSNVSHSQFEEIKHITETLAKYIPVVITTLGSMGVLITRKASERDPFYKNSALVEIGEITSRLYRPHTVSSTDTPLSVSGCGDCLNAGIIFGIHHGLSESSCVSLALKAAALSLASLDPVPSTLTQIDINAYE